MNDSAIKPIDPNVQAEILAQFKKLAELNTDTAPVSAFGIDPKKGLDVDANGHVWTTDSNYTSEQHPTAHGDTDGSAKSAQNLNAQFRAKATNVPHGPHTFASQQVFTSQDARDLVGAFSSDTSPLGQAWNQVVSGVDDGGTAQQALFAEVKDKIKSIVPADQVDDTAQAIVDFADGLHDRAMTPIRNIR